MERILKKRKKIPLNQLLGVEEGDKLLEGYLSWRDTLDQVRRVMIKKGVTKAELARKMGVSRQAIHDRFIGKNTTFEWIERMCDALGLVVRFTVMEKRKAA
ncbi:MAG: helix-turn-helix transcriptional regulator [Deltaproteobacteria bacterium]|nr:MAG: helix-turn-helix transcriptional regulator [Deltaproteobacteria bacterium]